MPPLLLVGAALGGAAMYFFDPDRGRSRRALVRAKVVKAESCVRDFVDAGTRDLANRGTALTGRVRFVFRRRKGDDRVLVERVRAKMGRYVAHPGAIDVSALAGQVTLSGSVLAHEHPELIEVLCTVQGVKDVIDRLSVYETAEGISELQGDRQRREGSMLPQNWSAGTQLLAGAAVAVFLLKHSTGARGLLALAAGTAVLLRMSPQERLRHLAPAGDDKAVDTPEFSEMSAAPEEIF